MDVHSGPARGSALLKALFYLTTLLVGGALGYAVWIVVSTWHRVGV